MPGTIDIDYRSIFGRNITIFSDSKSAVAWFNGEDFRNFNLVHLVHDIRQFLLSWEGLEIIYVPRDMNSLADCLAKTGSRGHRNRLEWAVSG